MPLIVRWMFCLVAICSYANDTLQALTPTEHNPLYLRFLQPQWQPVERQEPSTWRIGVANYYANIFERRQSASFFQDFDAEMLSLDFHAHWQASAQWVVQARMAGNRFSGGFLDSSVQSFHSTFGLPNDNREDVANNRFAMVLFDATGHRLFQAQAHRWYFTNPHFSLAWQPQLKSWQIAAGITLKAPLGSGPFHNSNWDGSMDFHLRKKQGPWHFDFQTGWVSISSEDPLAPITNSSAVYGKLWLQRNFKSFAIFTHLDAATAYFQNTNLDSLDPAPVNLLLGLQIKPTQNSRLSFKFGEDLTSQGPSLDFSLTVGWQFSAP